MQTHFKVWEDRSYLYQRIKWDLTQIQANIALVMAGKEPQASPLPKRGQLQLPAPAELVL